MSISEKDNATVIVGGAPIDMQKDEAELARMGYKQELKCVLFAGQNMHSPLNIYLDES